MFQVCIPGLHISLGIFDRLWELLEESCTELDLHLAEHDSGGTFDRTFARYKAALVETSQLKSQLESLKQSVTVLDQLVTFFSLRVPNPSQNTSLQTIRKEAGNKTIEIKRTVSIVQHFCELTLI